MEEQCGFVWCPRALEERTEHSDDDCAAGEIGECVTSSYRARGRVKFIPIFHQSRRRRHVVVSAERDHKNIGVIGRPICDDSAAPGIN
jgi:hypothetical protein